MMRVKSAENRGKKSKGKLSFHRENIEYFLSLSKRKSREFFENFPHREKVGKIPRFSEGRKSTPLRGVIITFSLTVNGERKAGLSAARRPPFPCH